MDLLSLVEEVTITVAPYDLASELDLAIDQGATYQLDLLLLQLDGTPLDLTGWTPRGQIRRTYRSLDVAAVLDLPVLDAAGGRLGLRLSAAVTAELQARDHVYDVEVVHEAGRVRRLVQGGVYVSPRVTR